MTTPQGNESSLEVTSNRETMEHKRIGHAAFVMTRHPLARADHGRVAVLRTSLAALEQLADRVTVFVTRQYDESTPTSRGNTTFVPVPRFRSDIGARLARLADPRRSLNEAAGLTPRQAKSVVDVAGSVDLWVLDGVRTCEIMRHNGQTPSFVDLDDLLSERYAHWSKLDLSAVPFDLVGTQPNHPLNRLGPAVRRIYPTVFRIESRLAANAERTIVGLADGISLVSESEASRLSTRTGRAIEALPMATGLSPVEGAKLPDGSDYCLLGPYRYDVVFVGHVSYLTNLVGLQWFGTLVCPALHQRLGRPPKIAVVGSVEPGVAKWLRSLGMDPLGFQEDLGQVVRTAAVAIAPQSVPGGLITKVLDYTRIGIPVVGTTSAFSGFGSPSAIPWVGADDPVSMSSRIVELIEDRTLAKSSADAATEFVGRCFSIRQVNARWTTALINTLDNHD